MSPSNQGMSIIPIALRKGPIQKFKLPFKGEINNFNELDIDFNFTQISASIKGNELNQSSSASPVEFLLQPNQVKINNAVQSFLNITAKFKNSYQLQEDQSDQKLQKNKNKPEIYNHLLIGRIKDTHIMFSYVVQVSLID